MIQTQQSFRLSVEDEEEEVRKESHVVDHKGRTCSRDARNTQSPYEIQVLHEIQGVLGGGALDWTME